VYGHWLKVTNASTKMPLSSLLDIPSHEQWVFLVGELSGYRASACQTAIKSVKCMIAMFWNADVVGDSGCRLSRNERHGGDGTAKGKKE